MQVLVDGLLTAYTRQGKGKVVVLLHGWGDRGAGLRGLQAALAKQYDVIAMDLPGFGQTQTQAEAWGLTDYASFVGHFLEKVGITKVYSVIGHSNGGAIAVRGLATGFLEANKLVILGGAGIRGEYQGRNRFLRYVAKAGKFITSPLPASIKQRLRRRAYQTIGSDMFVAEQLQDTFKRIVTDDVREDAAKLKLPTLLIYGTEDTSTPVRYGMLFHEAISRSKLETIPKAGHFVHVDQPDAVLKRIEEFLK